jgi:hypothetical protein
MGGCVEAEFIDKHGELSYAEVRQYHYSDERGSLWGHYTGSLKDGTYKTHHPKYYRWRFTGPLVPSLEAQGRSILVWNWRDAPGELRCLSEHGGDEDYVGLLPSGLDVPSWMESGSSFGCCSVSEHAYDDGRTVFIGAHA